MPKQRRLLSIGHSYCVALNRRLAHEMAVASNGDWDVHVVSPKHMRAGLRPMEMEPAHEESCRLEGVTAHFTKYVHVMLYGRRLNELLQQPWDLVHCWEEPYILAGGQIAWLTPRNTAFVFYTMQNIVKSYPPPFSWIEKYSLDRCDGWLAVGNTVVDTLMQRGYERKPHEMIPLGVDIERFSPSPESRREVRNALGWPESGPPVIGFLGRLVPEKGLTLLMSLLEQIRSPWRFLIVGTGPMERELRKWGERFGDRVRVATDVKHDMAPAYLNAMDLLCSPSQTVSNWREQLGRMLIEAFACGVPVVGSDSGEIPHVIGDAGLVVNESDEAAWRRTLADLLESPSQRRELSERGLERVRTRYSWPVIARQHLDFFSTILDSRREATLSNC